MGRFDSMRRPMGGFLPASPPPAEPVVVRDEAAAAFAHRAEVMGRLLLRKINQLEKQMADQVVTTQDILNVVHDQQGVIASMSTFITAMHQRIVAGIGSQLSPQAQADLNEIFAEVRGNTNAITQAIAANTDPAPSTGAQQGSGVADTGSSSSAAASGTSSTGPAANPIDQGGPSLSATVTTLSTSKAIANVGDTVTLTAGVSGKDSNPKAITGSVSFHDEDGMLLGNTTLDSTGVAALFQR